MLIVEDVVSTLIEVSRVVDENTTSFVVIDGRKEGWFLILEVWVLPLLLRWKWVWPRLRCRIILVCIWDQLIISSIIEILMMFIWHTLSHGAW
jgi:hypothetical protein